MVAKAAKFAADAKKKDESCYPEVREFGTKSFGGYSVRRPSCSPGLCCGKAAAAGADAKPIDVCSYSDRQHYLYTNPKSASVEKWSFTCYEGSMKLVATYIAATVAAYMMI